jgi:hypothetical protein
MSHNLPLLLLGVLTGGEPLPDPPPPPFRHRSTLPRAYVHEPWWPYQQIAELTTASNIDRSYVIMQPGQCVLDVARTDPQVSVDVLQRGNILVIEADDLPPWAGNIVTLDESLAGPVIELVAVGLAGALDARLTPQRLRYDASIGAAVVFRDLVTRANSRGHTGVHLPAFNEPSVGVTELDLGGATVLDALTELAERTSQEWWLEIQRVPSRLEAVIRWGVQGEDSAADVHLYEGHHFSDLRYRLDLSQYRQAVTAIGGTGAVGDRAAVTLSATTEPRRAELASVLQEASTVAARNVSELPPGLRLERLIFEPGADSEAALSRRAKRALEQPLGAGEQFSVVVNREADWSLLVLGSHITIHVELSLASISREMRIVGLQPDEAAGEMELVTEVVLR